MRTANDSSFDDSVLVIHTEKSSEPLLYEGLMLKKKNRTGLPNSNHVQSLLQNLNQSIGSVNFTFM